MQVDNLSITNDDPIFNVCVKCGRTIKVRTPLREYIKEMLQESKTAVCDVCDPKSPWRRVVADEEERTTLPHQARR